MPLVVSTGHVFKDEVSEISIADDWMTQSQGKVWMDVLAVEAVVSPAISPLCKPTTTGIQAVNRTALRRRSLIPFIRVNPEPDVRTNVSESILPQSRAGRPKDQAIYPWRFSRLGSTSIGGGL